MPRITVSIDPDGCISAANCVGVAPELFRIAALPHVELLDRNGIPHGTSRTLDVSEAELARIEEAAESCPTRAIVVAALGSESVTE
jgi:ferredoxin